MLIGLLSSNGFLAIAASLRMKGWTHWQSMSHGLLVACSAASLFLTISRSVGKSFHRIQENDAEKKIW
ncbi:hypothetical protein TNCV_3424841 [Trichonephila clavipes]|nr:hypothetical protein TNCV_3424841 [Trichonephila clavipes]